jgi:hypothetical protein
MNLPDSIARLGDIMQMAYVPWAKESSNEPA